MLTALRQWWMDQWVAPAHTESYVWRDDELPADLDLVNLRVSVTTQGNQRQGIGREREQPRGLIQVEVQNPRKNGPGPGEVVASAVAAVWRAFRHERITLDAPSVVGLLPDGAFNRHLVTLGWRGDMRLAQ